MAGGRSARSITATVGLFTAGPPGSTSVPIGVSEGPRAKAQSTIAAAGCQVPVGLAISDRRQVLPPPVAASTKVNLAATVGAVLDTYGALAAEEQPVVMGDREPWLELAVGGPAAGKGGLFWS
jgi:hypothetical protein